MCYFEQVCGLFTKLKLHVVISFDSDICQFLNTYFKLNSRKVFEKSFNTRLRITVS